MSIVNSAIGADAKFNAKQPKEDIMGQRFTLLIAFTLVLLPWALSTNVVATDARGSEGGSILLEEKTIASDEPLEATIGLWGRTLGRN